MQTTGELIILARKFPPGVQLAEDELDGWHPLFRVDIHRHAATIVDHLQRLILIQDHLNGARVTGQRLIHAVVDDLLSQVVRTAGIGIHAGTTAHRLEAF